MSPAGRPREFDEAEVLDRAVEQFWVHGYDATSLTDLIEATGLQKGSIYKAFGDKHTLFMTALDRYLDFAYSLTRNQLASGETAAEGLSTWLEGVVQRMKSGSKRCGCFAVNAAVELAPRDAKVRDRLRRQDRRMLALLKAAVEGGQRNGDFRDDREAAELAEYVLTMVNGLSAGARRDAQIGRAQRIVDVVLETLKP